ncbi:MAG: hypothetical protein HY000_32560 [Planctomycetes bacterium]|nr:hypothetical protein [Planctomycetota bacterium]
MWKSCRNLGVACVILSGAAAAVWAQTQQGKQAKQPARAAQPGNVDDRSTPESERLQQVPEILSVEAQVLPRNPPTLVVTAVGQTPTTGWTNVQLVRRIYVTPPADGMWEYDLLGVRPTRVAGAALQQFKRRNNWDDYDKSINGIRVYGVGRGVKEIRLTP